MRYIRLAPGKRWHILTDGQEKCECSAMTVSQAAEVRENVPADEICGNCPGATAAKAYKEKLRVLRAEFKPFTHFVRFSPAKFLRGKRSKNTPLWHIEADRLFKAACLGYPLSRNFEHDRVVKVAYQDAHRICPKCLKIAKEAGHPIGLRFWEDFLEPPPVEKE